LKYFNLILIFILTSSCSSLSIDKEKIKKLVSFDYEEVNLTPEDTTGFQCANNEIFYLRYLEENNAVWVILKDREFRLDKNDGGNDTYTYTNSTISLDINEDSAVIEIDSPTLYEECQKITPKT
jgi:hypothetical protein|tara:strand:- start:379 stop:750 length:372 start_codon:yes stop_codon:yes gene_type:complete